jgi:putative ABC transport system substrate-binding protein
VKNKIAVFLLLFLYCPGDFPAEAVESTKVPRIGYLVTGGLAGNLARVEAFRLGLKQHGYVEGKNIVIEYRFGEGNSAQISEMARNLVTLKVDIIFAVGAAAIEAAKNATRTIPIITTSGDPIASGLVDSLARPGGNVTGLTNFTQELAGKRLELLKDVLPQFSRVSVLWSYRGSTSALRLKQVEVAAQSQGLQVYATDIQNAGDLELGFAAMKKERTDALVMLRHPLIISLFDRIIELAANYRMPVMYDDKSVVQKGGLLSYGADLADLDRRAAFYVHRILKGVKPSELPVERPTKFELVINLKAAEKIGLTIPDSVLRWADEIIR